MMGREHEFTFQEFRGVPLGGWNLPNAEMIFEEVKHSANFAGSLGCIVEPYVAIMHPAGLHIFPLSQVLKTGQHLVRPFCADACKRLNAIFMIILTHAWTVSTSTKTRKESVLLWRETRGTVEGYPGAKRMVLVVMEGHGLLRAVGSVLVERNQLSPFMNVRLDKSSPIRNCSGLLGEADT